MASCGSRARRFPRILKPEDRDAVRAKRRISPPPANNPILWACAAAAVLVLVCADGPDTDLLASGGAAGAVERSSQAAGDVVSIPDGGLRERIERALGKAAGASITVAEMGALTTWI